MNRSILIVICDFLLVSLLFFSSGDIGKMSNTPGQLGGNEAASTNRVDSGKDLAAAMRMALTEERKGQQKLAGELEQARTQAEQAKTQAEQARTEAERAKAESAAREKQIEQTRLALENQQKSSQQIQQAKSELEQRYAAAQSNLANLNSALQNASTQAALSKEKLAEMESGIRKQTDESAALREKLAMLQKSNEVAFAEQQRLANQLQLAEVERRHASEEAARMQEEVKVQREEKARLTAQNEKLAEGVKTLANKSGELAREVRESRPLAPNTIFNEFVTNRVHASFVATRQGLLGEASKRKDTQTILVTDGKKIYALCHVQDTPLTLWTPGTDWEGLQGTLSRNGAAVPIHSLFFHLRDPRVIWMPVTQEEARALGCRIYKISSDPYKFQDAVLVGASEGYYGECRFQIELSTPDYVKLDNSFLKGLFGKFNPSRGDIVFSRTGEFLGIMANGSYCMIPRNFEASATFQFGSDIRNQNTGQILSQLYSMVMDLPPRLQ
ncbi:MAG TPA: hypothetical protein VHH88_02710 [Verrucomicrobiae bacterium]|nr:hypothetical protein [Verrucomicrobiae bacterium]